ncbi:FecR domain-containing protein [Echinicola sp. CAU 1574]|uniref:FecR domain-containing protein n=1 Tax=Echinicola arenosa TaxID=2774144 RepID=A0ABR9AHN3_9BACT|nr:FecR family protein [Echinicola arenosa]MBD8487353.1 FecR domain-containing protein [Echinicola arenosa]
MKYTDYDTEDFLKDEFFIRWILSPDEQTDHFWKKWCENHPEKKQQILMARDFIRSVNYGEEEIISDQLYTDIYEAVVAKDISDPTETKTINWSWLKNIAAVTLVVSCFYLGYSVIKQPNEENRINEELVIRENPSGIKSVLTLSDGTVVHLNSESSLQFPEHFNDSVRSVKLTGEAFFEVAEDKAKPFVISAGGNNITVLGTTFNIKQSENFTIALVTGKVKVEDPTGNKILMKPKEMLIMEEGGKIVKKEFDPLEVIGWKDKYLVFKHNNFEEIKEKIESWYGVKIQGGGQFDHKWSYTGVYYNEPLEKVLEGISITSKFDYIIEGKKVIINNPK